MRACATTGSRSTAAAAATTLAAVQTARGTPAMALPQLLRLCRVLPDLVTPHQLGFRGRLRFNTMVADIMEDVFMRWVGGLLIRDNDHVTTLACKLAAYSQLS